MSKFKVGDKVSWWEKRGQVFSFGEDSLYPVMAVFECGMKATFTEEGQLYLDEFPVLKHAVEIELEDSEIERLRKENYIAKTALNAAANYIYKDDCNGEILEFVERPSKEVDKLREENRKLKEKLQKVELLCIDVLSTDNFEHFMEIVYGKNWAKGR